MASAILLFYTSEGFLIAADGRARINGIVDSDSTTKIFSISEPNRSLAYAFGGSVALTDKDDPGIILFDFRAEALKIIESLRSVAYDNLSSYANDCSAELFKRLVSAQKNERMEKFSEKNPSIVYVFFAGYVAGQPSYVTVQFLREGQIALPPVVDQMPLTKGYKPLVPLYGSGVVAQHIFEMDDPEFANYRVGKVNVADSVRLSEVADVASKYFSACADPEAMKIDAEICQAIGGDIHIAKVTPENGFEWVIPPRDTDNPDSLLRRD